jgi:hypothetical protein
MRPIEAGDRGGLTAILLTDLLTTALDEQGHGWTHSSTMCRVSWPDRHSWIALDVPDLATDQKGAQLAATLAVASTSFGRRPRFGRRLTATPALRH